MRECKLIEDFSEGGGIDGLTVILCVVEFNLTKFFYNKCFYYKCSLPRYWVPFIICSVLSVVIRVLLFFYFMNDLGSSFFCICPVESSYH